MAIFLFRYLALWLALAFAALAPYFALQGEGALFWWLVTACAWALSALGLRDLTQTHHAILRNYPIIGHLRYLFEDLRPAIRQYFFEADTEETPFSRASRSLVYQRAKQEIDKRPFGTQLDVYDQHYEWINHSLAPSTIADSNFRLTVGGPACTQPVSLSVLNISAMSFGAELINPLAFFVMVITLFPLALGAEIALLKRIAPAIIWVAALLASLMSIENLFRADYDDGSLELMVMTPHPLSILVLAKVIGHWLVSSVPLLFVAPLMGMMLHMDADIIGVLMLTLLLGTPVLSLIGGIAVALTI